MTDRNASCEERIDEGDPTRVEYVFQDWFDGARRTVTDEDRDVVLEYLDPWINSDALHVYGDQD